MNSQFKVSILSIYHSIQFRSILFIYFGGEGAPTKVKGEAYENSMPYY